MLLWETFSAPRRSHASITTRLFLAPQNATDALGCAIAATAGFQAARPSPRAELSRHEAVVGERQQPACSGPWSGRTPVTAMADHRSLVRRRNLCQSRRWSQLVAAAATRQSAVAEITFTLSGCFRRRRTGALDPLLPSRFERSCSPTLALRLSDGLGLSGDDERLVIFRMHTCDCLRKPLYPVLVEVDLDALIDSVTFK